MTECIVCGEKIENGQKFCSICAPEEHHHSKGEEKVEEPVVVEPAEVTEENDGPKIEIKKDDLIIENKEEDSE